MVTRLESQLRSVVAPDGIGLSVLPTSFLPLVRWGHSSHRDTTHHLHPLGYWTQVACIAALYVNHYTTGPKYCGYSGLFDILMPCKPFPINNEVTNTMDRDAWCTGLLLVIYFYLIWCVLIQLKQENIHCLWMRLTITLYFGSNKCTTWISCTKLETISSSLNFRWFHCSFS